MVLFIIEFLSPVQYLFFGFGGLRSLDAGCPSVKQISFSETVDQVSSPGECVHSEDVGRT